MQKSLDPKVKEYIIENYGKLPIEEMVKFLGRTKSTIMSYASRFGAAIPITLIQPGERFGRLEVVERTEENKGKGRLYLCKCDCGNEVKVLSESLRSGNTRSCDCIKREIASSRSQKDVGIASYRPKFSFYKHSAKKRGYSWDLTMEQFKEITSKNCYYCNKEPNLYNHYYKKDGSRKHKDTTNETANRAWILFNGIDRVDNSIGYELDNIVPCCSEHNYEKSDVSKIVILKAAEFLLKKEKV